MRKHLFPLFAALLAAAATAGFAVADDERPAFGGGSRFQSIGLWGDVPYSDEKATTGVPNLLADMTPTALPSPCTWATSRAAAAVATTSSTRAYSSHERLQYIRSTLFGTSQSFGQGRFAQMCRQHPSSRTFALLRVDKPLLDRVGNRIEHFTRVEAPGDNAQSSNNDVQWVKANVDTHDPEVFSFEQEVVESNLVPYVA